MNNLALLQSCNPLNPLQKHTGCCRLPDLVDALSSQCTETIFVHLVQHQSACQLAVAVTHELSSAYLAGPAEPVLHTFKTNE